MDELSLRLKIADRDYPMKVKTVEEKNVRAAAKLVNEKLKTFKTQFGIDDKQDLLAMVAFDSMIKILAGNEDYLDQTETYQILEKLNQQLKSHLED